MEYIRKAVERARVSSNLIRSRESANNSSALQGQGEVAKRTQPAMQLDRAHLESKRIVAHDIADRRSSAFDMLRTQILQAMDAKGWHLLAVTSPTAGCGKTLMATNLALSIARLPERAVLLLDLDLRRPQVAVSLGLRCEFGLLSALQGKTPLREAIIPVGVDRYRIDVLIAEHSVPNASEWMASRNMKALLELIRRDFPSHIVIIDTAPMLAADDFLTVLPQMDCVLLVGAVGTSTVSDIEHCKRHLQSANVVRVVLNKVRDTNRPYYG
jgi:Mrp family chromosome partitioning ATPase